MKKIFKLKFEVINIILSVVGMIISYSLKCDVSDWRAKMLVYLFGVWFLLSIIGYKFIKDFRKDVLKRW